MEKSIETSIEVLAERIENLKNVLMEYKGNCIDRFEWGTQKVTVKTIENQASAIVEWDSRFELLCKLIDNNYSYDWLQNEKYKLIFKHGDLILALLYDKKSEEKGQYQKIESLYNLNKQIEIFHWIEENVFIQ